MVALGSNLSTEGLEALGEKLDDMAAAAATLEERALPLIAADFHRMSAERFDAEGPGWAELAPSTQAKRARAGKGPAHPILQFDGHLVGSLTHGGAPGSVTRVEPDALFVGTDVPYATYHQHGTPRMPARPIVVMDEEDARRWGRIVSELLYTGGHLSTIVGVVS